MSGRRRISSKIASGFSGASCARSFAGAACDPPTKPKTRIPARCAASTPAGLSSITRHRDGSRRHRVGGVQEQIRRRLAASDRGGAEDPGIEQVQEPDRLERETNALDIARRRDAAAQRKGANGGGHIRDRGEVVAKAPIQTIAHGLKRLVGQPHAEFGLQDLQGRFQRASEEAVIDDALVQRHAGGRDRLHQRVRGDRLAVDQHAVAIEDDQVSASRPIVMVSPLFATVMRDSAEENVFHAVRRRSSASAEARTVERNELRVAQSSP